MITRPGATCPRCGSRFKVMDAISVSRHAQEVIYYAECSCGAADLTVNSGKITGITPRDPIEIPEYTDEPTALEYEEYLAQ